MSNALKKVICSKMKARHRITTTLNREDTSIVAKEIEDTETNMQDVSANVEKEES